MTVLGISPDDRKSNKPSLSDTSQAPQARTVLPRALESPWHPCHMVQASSPLTKEKTEVRKEGQSRGTEPGLHPTAQAQGAAEWTRVKRGPALHAPAAGCPGRLQDLGRMPPGGSRGGKRGAGQTGDGDMGLTGHNKRGEETAFTQQLQQQ